MAKQNGKTGAQFDQSVDYRHKTKHKSNTPAKIAAERAGSALDMTAHPYSARFSPILRFDQDGKADILERRVSIPVQAQVHRPLVNGPKHPRTVSEARTASRERSMNPRIRTTTPHFLAQCGQPDDISGGTNFPAAGRGGA